MELIFDVIQLMAALGKIFGTLLSIYFGYCFLFKNYKNKYWYGIAAILFGVWSK